MAHVVLCVLNANVTDLTLSCVVYDSIAGCPWLACYKLHLVDVRLLNAEG